MRTVTPQTAAKLQQRLGTEPLLLVEVEWVPGNFMMYSDQDVAGAITKLISLGGFDTSMTLTGSGDSQEVSVVLDDTDGSLRSIYEHNDVHKRPAKVYLLFKGLDISHKMLLSKGEVVTPIEWDEAQRTVSFSILSQLASVEAGFAMEEGDFPNIPEEALGKAWPLVFGQVCHMPAVQMRAPRRGYLLQGEGISDFTLDARICQAIRITCPSQPTGDQQKYLQGANNVWTANTVATVGPDIECVNRRFGEICKLKDLKDQMAVWEHSTMNIYNGVSFPQHQDMTIYIEGATFRGNFNGNTFTVNNRQHPDYATFNHPVCKDVPKYGYGVSTTPTAFFQQREAYWTTTNNGGVAFVGDTAWTTGVGTPNPTVGVNSWWSPDSSGSYFRNDATQNAAAAFKDCETALSGGLVPVGGPADSWKYYDEMEASDFFWAPAGSEVYMESEAEVLYIVSIIPGTVDGVAAYKTGANGKRYLTEVPASSYTVYETDYDGYTVVEIGMDKALNLLDEDWDEQIYVSFTSDVGPNPCDIIQWLIEKYTDITVDPTTFAYVKTKLTKYPTNFYLLDRKDVFELVKDIAYQSRCKVFVRNDVLYITYLSLEPTSLRTITADDILVESFVDSLSQTEDVYTTHKITWRPSGAPVEQDAQIDRKIILKYNVNKYGTVIDEYDYYCYNIYELALKSSTFWLIRKANSWRMVEFDVPLRHIDLDIGDCITLDVDYFGDPVKCIVEASQYNSDKNTVHLTCWTPIRSGETEPYFWAWPSQQPAPSVWPMPGDNNGGAGYNFDVTPPLGHLMLGGMKRYDQVVLTTGDLHPSDLDDTLPSVSCELSDYIDFDQVTPEIEAKQIAQSVARSQAETIANGGGGSGGSSKKDKPEDKEEQGTCPKGVGCNYNVVVTWHTSTSQGQAKSIPPPGPPKYPNKCGGPCECSGGCPSCTGKVWNICHTFGTPWAARAFAAYMGASYGTGMDGSKGLSGMWTCGETRAVSVKANNGPYVQSTPGIGSFASDCESIGDSNSTQSGGEQGGEIRKPQNVGGDPTGCASPQTNAVPTTNPYYNTGETAAPTNQTYGDANPYYESGGNAGADNPYYESGGYAGANPYYVN